MMEFFSDRAVAVISVQLINFPLVRGPLGVRILLNFLESFTTLMISISMRPVMNGLIGELSCQLSVIILLFFQEVFLFSVFGFNFLQFVQVLSVRIGVRC